MKEENKRLTKENKRLTEENKRLTEDLSRNEKLPNSKPLKMIQTIKNSFNNCNISLTLSKIENSIPLTKELINEKAEKAYRYLEYVNGYAGLNSFIEMIVIINPKELNLNPLKAGFNYVCTDIENQEFYSLRPRAEAASAPLGDRVD